MKVFNPDKELKKIQKGNRNKIIFSIVLLLVVSIISYSFALYQVRYSKRIIYTKVAPFSSKDLDLAVYVNGTKQNKVPEKDSEYNFASIECDDGIPIAEWDEENWNFKQISNINIPNKCNVYFSDVVQEFQYTQTIQEYIIPKDGVYKLEVWGAQGGNGFVEGGLGGYSNGKLSLKSGDTLYIVVGGAGSGNGTHVYQAGGYNGGGNANSNEDSNTRQASGGGATHIATYTGLLSELKNNKDSIIIVAGGGGGMGYNSALTTQDSQFSSNGTGGGFIGGTGEYLTTKQQLYQGFGGTQEAGGDCVSFTSTCAAGTFGLGASNITAGGGGGYYGGGASWYVGGGGSGYLSSKLDETTATTINGVNSGNGKAKISYISA